MIDLIILSMFAISFVIFFYGIFKYADVSESENKVAKILLVSVACSSLASIMTMILIFTR